MVEESKLQNVTIKDEVKIVIGNWKYLIDDSHMWICGVRMWVMWWDSLSHTNELKMVCTL